MRVHDARTLAELKLPVPADAAAVTVGSLSRDGRFAVVGVDSGKAPRTSFVIDWQTGNLTEWALATAPEVDVSKFAVARLDSYTARDGTKIPMFVRYPAQCAPESQPTGDPCPIVVEFHGGPEGQATPGFSGFSQLFVDAGFIFAEPNVRGSDGYGKAWLDADNGAKRLDVISDIDDAGKALRARFTRNGKAPKDRDHRRQLWRLLGAHGHDDVRRAPTTPACRSSASRTSRRFCRTRRPIGERCGPASTAIPRRTPRR